MSNFSVIPPTGSVDTLSMVHNCETPPVAEALIERGFESAPGRFPGTKSWFHNGVAKSHVPRITFYQTWERYWRVRADVSVPKFLFEHNVKLPSIEEIHCAVELVSTNIHQRIGMGFDGFSALVARVDFAVNILCPFASSRALLEHYSRQKISWFLRTSVDSTVYFANKSRAIRLYDKYSEVLEKNPSSLRSLESAQDVVRAEYYFKRATAVNRFAMRLGFDNSHVATVTSKDFIRLAANELHGLLELNKVNLGAANDFRAILAKTGSVKDACALSGFVSAVNALGQDFYRDPALAYSKSTYERNRRRCSALGIPF